MNKHRISFGPGAASLILVIVTLCLSLLGLLSLSRAAADVSEQVYAATAAAERTLAALDDALLDCAARAQDDNEYLALIAAALPDNMEMDGRLIYFTASAENRTLCAAVEVAERGESPRLIWREHKVIVEDAEWN